MSRFLWPLGLASLLAPLAWAGDEQPIDRQTLDRWAAPYRGWRYWPEPIMPAEPRIPGYETFRNIDSPCVYQLPGQPDKWYMSFIGFNGQGYNSFVTESTDLIHWREPRLAMGFGQPGSFDHGGCVIGAFLYDSYDIQAPRVLSRRDGKFWTLYGCYPRQGGYELRPGYEGVAVSDDGRTWRRAKDQPILAVSDADCGAWEKSCIYQPWLVAHEGRFFDFYNAAQDGVEQTGLALSADLLNWQRHPGNPLIRVRPKGYDERFASDPKVFRDGDHWIMFYFGVGRGGAHIMAAFSRDLLHWTAHPEPLYKAGGHPRGLDKTYAHKISLVYRPQNKTFYMYYCAVGTKGRCIALLTSRALDVPMAPGRSARTKSPLDDAMAVWHMNEPQLLTDNSGQVRVEGEVELGVKLAPPDLDASLRRGGDGRVARFKGGCLLAAIPAGREQSLRGKEATLYVRLQDFAGDWSSPLVAKDAPDDEYANILYGRDGSLHYVWRTVPIEQRALGQSTADARRRGRDFLNGVLRLRAPAEMIGPTAWHDVAVRFRGPNLELFVDGVLVDEEWPHGELCGFSAPFLFGAGYENGRLKTGFRGQIDHVALWNRALRNDEIAALAGGAEEVARRDREILGPAQASVQYWKPRGYNAWAGDCMPFYHDGVFHLFYLFDRRHHGSKWGQGAHQYAHASSKDLIHWEHHALAVPIVRQWECSMGTCDCIWRNGRYHLFYTDCGSRCEYKDKPQRGSWIFCATSSDGIHFHKDLKPLAPGGDCTVFRDPATGLFHLIRGGANRMVSKDLRRWEETPGDFVQRKPGTTGECPRLFAWNGWFYFILGTNAVWKSRGALGPWEEMKPAIYDGLFVPKVAEFTGNRRILAGFLFERGWAGHLALRELVQFPDGGLGAKFAPELIPASGNRLNLSLASAAPGVSGDGRQITIQAAGKPATAALAGVPRDVRITLRVVPQRGVESFGLCLRGKGTRQGGCELRFEPGRNRAQYGVADKGGLAKEAVGRIAAGRDFAIEGVENLDRPFNLDILVKGDIIDTCIDGRRTMITRRVPEPDGDCLAFFAVQGKVRFEDVAVRPLLP